MAVVFKDCLNCKHKKVQMDEPPCYGCFVNPITNFWSNWEPKDEGLDDAPPAVNTGTFD